MNERFWPGPRWLAGTATVAAALLALAAAPVAAADWKPDHTVEIVAPSGPGGGNDFTARTLQQILKDTGVLTDTVVVNKEGGGGAVAYAYTHSKPGDGHIITVARTGLQSNQIIGRSPISSADLTALGMVSDDTQVIAVRADSPIKTVGDMVEKLKADPKSISIALGSSRGSTTEFVVAKIAKLAGIKPSDLRAVTFDGGKESVTNLLGGHVDMVCIGINNVLEFHKSGEARIIAVTTATRPALFSEVPTIREQGFDVVQGAWTAIVAPPGLSEEQIAYWSKTIEEATKHPLWTAMNDRKFVDYWYLGPDEAKKFLAADYAEVKELLTDLGMAQN